MSTTKDVDKKHIKILQEQLQKFQKKCKKYKAQLSQSESDNKSQHEKYDAIIQQFETEISKLKSAKSENYEQLEEYLRVQKEKDDQIDKYEKEISIFNSSLSKSQKESEETLTTFKEFMKNLIPDIENDCNYKMIESNNDDIGSKLKSHATSVSALIVSQRTKVVKELTDKLSSEQDQNSKLQGLLKSAREESSDLSENLEVWRNWKVF